MTIEAALSFSIAMLILAASPGPGVFASVSQALSGGFRSTLNVIAGLILGDLVYLMLAIFGLSAVASLLGEFFFVVRFGCGAYLIWLGYRMWVSPPDIFSATSRRTLKTSGQRFLAGLFITLGNPKVILFYIGFLPTFLELDLLRGWEIALVCCIVSTVIFLVMTLYAYFASKVRDAFAGRGAIRNLNRGAGSVMIGAGLYIAIKQ